MMVTITTLTTMRVYYAAILIETLIYVLSYDRICAGEHAYKRTLASAKDILAFTVFPCSHPHRSPPFPFLFLPFSSVLSLYREHNENKSISLHSRVSSLQRTLESIVVGRALQHVKRMLFKLILSSDFLLLTDRDFSVVSEDAFLCL